MSLRQVMMMLSGRMWAVGEIFSAVGEAFGGSKKKTAQTTARKPKNSPANPTKTAAIPAPDKARKAKMRGMLSAIEKGAMKPRSKPG